MLSNIKNKLVSATKNVGLLKDEEKQEKTKKSSNLNEINTAGAKILSNFQQQWAEIHELNEQNASAVQNVATQISNMHLAVYKTASNIAEMNKILNSAKSFKSIADSCVSQLKQLQNSAENVEKSLILLEDLTDQVELERMKIKYLEHYRMNTLKNLEEAEKHAKQAEEQTSKELDERQKVFQEAFLQDLQTFKTLGTIPKIERIKPTSALLEEIDIDCDDGSLKEFLDS